MTCERCNRTTDGIISGFEAQNGAHWCVACCLDAGLTVPAALATRHTGDRTNAIRTAWLERQAQEKRAKLHAFLESRKQAQDEPKPAPMIIKASAATPVQGGLFA